MKRTLGILVALVALVALLCVPAAAETVEPATPVYTDPYMVTLNPSTEMNILWLTKEACEDPTKAIYPDGDYCWDVLRPVYEEYGVDAVNFGHSHVYERYQINGVNYIEAASIGNNYRGTADPYHPSGNLPVVEENNFRSIMLVHVGADGMTAKGVQASVEDNGIGYIGRVFDTFTIAE